MVSIVTEVTFDPLHIRQTITDFAYKPDNYRPDFRIQE